MTNTTHHPGLKRRLSASIDAHLLFEAEQAVEAGRAATVSAWVNEAFQQKIDHDQRLLAMDRFLADFEAEFGPISEEDIENATLRTRSAAVVVRAQPGCAGHDGRSSRDGETGRHPARAGKAVTKRKTA
jgi:hypothetical protein